MRIIDRVGAAIVAGYVAAASGATGLLAFALFATAGQPFGTVGDVLLLVMTLAIAPIMLGSYELGGVTPLWPARLSLAAGTGAVIVWSVAQVAMILGLVSFDYAAGRATGALAVQALATIVVGAWLTGAPLLAGPWLPGPLRWLGAVSGVGFVLLGAGLLLDGADQPLTSVGGVGAQVLFPIWAFLLARTIGRDGRGEHGDHAPVPTNA